MVSNILLLFGALYSIRSVFRSYVQAARKAVSNACCSCCKEKPKVDDFDDIQANDPKGHLCREPGDDKSQTVTEDHDLGTTDACDSHPTNTQSTSEEAENPVGPKDEHGAQASKPTQGTITQI